MSNDQRNGGSIFTYDVSPGESLSEGVVAAVSTASGADAIPDSDSETGESLDPLYAAIDPDALDSVFRTVDPDSSERRGQITFTYHGREVTVFSEGRIAVRRLRRATGGAAD